MICRKCKYNPMGVCLLANKELGLKYGRANIAPKWCPKTYKKGVNKKYGK